MLQIVDAQRKYRLDPKEFESFGELLAGSIDESTGKRADVAFISDRRMIELNHVFRGKKRTTDVLSFQQELEEFEVQPPATVDGSDKTFLGDIVISVEQAARQAAENGLTLEAEIKQLILHGLLHLCGYDHETDDGEMNARELELREVLGI